MKTKLITIILLLMSLFGMGQTPRPVQKIINGKPCDTCLVKSDMSFSNIFPHVFIGTYTNPNRLSDKLSKFKESLKNENYQQHCNLITDSIFNLVFLTESDDNYDWPTGFKWDKNYDYNKIEILIEKNQKAIKKWQILDKLPPIDRYRINRITYDEKNQKDRIGSWSSTHQIGDLHLNYNDIITITLRQIDTKEILRKLYIKRILDKPNHFVYYQTSVNSSQFKKSLQSFLNDPVESDFLRNNDTINSFDLNRNNIGVFLFNALEFGEEIEYTFDKNKDWLTIRKANNSAFQNKFIILDDEDIPPGKTKTLYLRFKDQPETELPITIQGIEDIKQTSIFKITAGFLLASLLFGIWYYFKRRRTQKKLSQLDQKNKTIETQLSLLSGQLNPHFLFNTLHAIQGTIINNETDVANKYITNVAHFMRRVMDDGKKEFVSLQEELKLEEDYLKLEQQRKDFTYNITVSPPLSNIPIDFPPLLLQPVLENAIRHGLTSTVANPHIEMNITKEESNLIVQITDNGHYWDVDKLNEGTGLSLVNKRINLYNDKLAPLIISMHFTYANGTISTFTFKNWLA